MKFSSRVILLGAATVFVAIISPIVAYSVGIPIAVLALYIHFKSSKLDAFLIKSIKFCWVSFWVCFWIGILILICVWIAKGIRYGV